MEIKAWVLPAHQGHHWETNENDQKRDSWVWSSEISEGSACGEKIIFGWHAEVFSQSWWGGLEEEELRSKVQLGNTGKAVSFWPHLRENHYTDDGGDHHHIFGAHMENISSFDPRNSPTFSTIITVRARAKKDLNFPAFFHTNKWCLCTII